MRVRGGKDRLRWSRGLQLVCTTPAARRETRRALRPSNRGVFDLAMPKQQGLAGHVVSLAL